LLYGARDQVRFVASKSALKMGIDKAVGRRSLAGLLADCSDGAKAEETAAATAGEYERLGERLPKPTRAIRKR